jgi:hypothetical protein
MALVIQHGNHKRHTTVSPVACLDPPYFATSSHTRLNFREKKLLNTKLCFYFLLNVPETFRVQFLPKISMQFSNIFNHLTPELNPSAQRCQTRSFTGDFASWTVILLIYTYAWKTNKCNNCSFSFLIMYVISYMFRHYIAILRERS